MRIFLGLFFLAGLLFGDFRLSPTDPSAFYSDEPEVRQSKVLYLSYITLPERVFRGEIFPLTVKTLSTEEHFEEIAYRFEKGHGYTLLTPEPERKIEGRYFVDTFWFKSTAATMRTPDITATLRYSEFSESQATTLEGHGVKVITLNPPKDYANILAERFEITKYKTTRYNDRANIVVFSAQAFRSDIETLKLQGFEKQGIESVTPSHGESLITYYAVIPRRLEELRFKYFNLVTGRYTDVLIPIIVEDDTVSTQSDLKPVEHRHTQIKIAVAGGVAAFGLLMLILRRKLGYLLLIIVPGIYIAYAAVPTKSVCIKQGSPIYLLPMERGTTFEITERQLTMEVQGSVDGFVKVKLQNNKIGWVRHEDLCFR